MKEIIADILDEEKRAREHVQQAREKAKQLRLDAEVKAKAIVEEARKKAKEESRTLIDHAETEAIRLREEEMGKTTEMQHAIRTGKMKVIDQTVDILFRMVLGEESKER